MRLWTIHPGYLDAKGLVAVWREGLLARKVLEGKTKGYTRHPQLIRFRETDEPIARIDFYLAAILREAASRGYHFNESAIGTIEAPLPGRQIPVTVWQVEYEAELPNSNIYFDLLAKESMGIYIIHYPIVTFFQYLFTFMNMSGLIKGLFVTILSLSVSILSVFALMRIPFLRIAFGARSKSKNGIPAIVCAAIMLIILIGRDSIF